MKFFIRLLMLEFCLTSAKMKALSFSRNFKATRLMKFEIIFSSTFSRKQQLIKIYLAADAEPQ